MSNTITPIISYFVRSGDLSLDNGKFWYAGIDGWLWSSRGTTTRFDGTASLSGYVLLFDADSTNPSGGPHYRYVGIPLRCLSTVLDI